MTPRSGLSFLVATAATIAILAQVAAPAGARGLRLGLIDSLFYSRDAATQGLWLDRADAAGASVVGVTANWAGIAPTQPAGDAASPANSAYRWTDLDRVVRTVAARGYDVVLTLSGAPPWAEGSGRPADSVAPPGTWKPDPAAYGAFARAVATRYSGTFPDPAASGAALPRLRYFQIWNEPNLTASLAPQWSGKTPVAPGIYRKLLNAGYASVNAVHSDNLVLGPAMAPFGDNPGESRMRPVTFMRSLFCLNRKLHRTRCDEPARLEVITHHPIGSGPPQHHAGSPLDVTVADLDRLKTVVNAAIRARTLKPRGRKPYWVTEFWWASKPPSSFGVAPRRQALWLEEALYLFWTQGVSVATWLQIRDPEPSINTVGTGLYYQSGKPKPALRAYRFPFVTASATGGAHPRAWGIAPAPGTVQIQRRIGGSWRTIKRVARARAGVFVTAITAPRGALLRARQGSDMSLTWKQR